jgi:hypothetical protein
MYTHTKAQRHARTKAHRMSASTIEAAPGMCAMENGDTISPVFISFSHARSRNKNSPTHKRFFFFPFSITVTVTTLFNYIEQRIHIFTEGLAILQVEPACV